MNELWAALYKRLAAATSVTSLLSGTTAIYDSQAPAGAAFPLVIFQQQAGDWETIDPHTRHAKYVTVKAITAAGFQAGEAIDAAVAAQLDNNPLTMTGHTVIWQRRTEDVRYIEVDPAGANYYHVGGIYHITLAH